MRYILNSLSMLLLIVATNAGGETTIHNHISDRYNDFRKAISNSNLETFKELYYLTPGSEFPSESEFIESREDALFIFPGLQSLNIIKFKKNDKCAGIIYQVSDDIYIDLNIIKFKNINSTWKVYGGISGTAFNHAGVAKDDEALITNAVKNSEMLKVDC